MAPSLAKASSRTLVGVLLALLMAAGVGRAVPVGEEPLPSPAQAAPAPASEPSPAFVPPAPLTAEEEKALGLVSAGEAILHAERTVQAIRKQYEQTLRQMDRDGDGVVSPEERAMHKTGAAPVAGRKPARMDKTVSRFDLDRNFVLDEIEAAAARDVVRAETLDRNDKILRKFDTNGNGALDGEELTVARRAAVAAMDKQKPKTEPKRAKVRP